MLLLGLSLEELPEEKHLMWMSWSDCWVGVAVYIFGDDEFLDAFEGSL